MTAQLTLPTAQATLDAFAGPMTDDPPALPQLIAHTEQTTCVLVLDDSHPGGIQPMIASALEHVATEHGTPAWVTFAAEAWASYVPPDHNTRPGDFQRRAEQGDPSVTEAVILYGVAAAGAHWSGLRPYHRDNGELVWDAPLRVDNRNCGPILDLLQHATR